MIYRKSLFNETYNLKHTNQNEKKPIIYFGTLAYNGGLSVIFRP